MAILRLSDGNELLIKDGFMDSAFQIEINNISEWGNVESILTDSNMEKIEIIKNENITILKNKTIKSFDLHKDKEGKYFATVFIEDLSDEMIRLNSVEKSVKYSNDAIAKMMKDLAALIMKGETE